MFTSLDVDDLDFGDDSFKTKAILKNIWLTVTREKPRKRIIRNPADVNGIAPSNILSSSDSSVKPRHQKCIVNTRLTITSLVNQTVAASTPPVTSGAKPYCST